MSTHVGSLADDLLLCLRVAHVHFDLSTILGRDRVIIDEGEPPPVDPPWVALGMPDDIEIESISVGLVQYQVKGTFKWVAFAPADRESPIERAVAASELANDIVTAIMAARGDSILYPTLGRCQHITLSVNALSGGSSSDGLSTAMSAGVIRYEAITTGGI